LLRNKYRLFRKYADSDQSFIIFLLKSFWINVIKKRTTILWNDQIKWIVDSRFQSSKNPFYYNHVEREEFIILSTLLKEGDVFYDIGANVGLYSIFLAAKYKIKCYAFEPDEHAAKLNEQNQILNSITHLVTVFPFAISDVNGFTEFSTELGINNKIISNGCRKTVESNKLDNLNHLTKPHAIKIDTEGHELNILRGASSILSSPQLKLLILEYDKTEIHKIINLLKTYQFEPVSLEDGNLKLNTKLHPTRSGNMIFIRRKLIV
jgi:FkbM family methyltransferase